MLDLDEKYLGRLQEIAEGIQNSDAYAAYMDTEEEAEYKVICDIYEPRISKIYAEVAANDPLQLISLERILLNPFFEGLFLQRILGFSVLRGQINEQVKYVRPQNHFKEVSQMTLYSASSSVSM